MEAKALAAWRSGTASVGGIDIAWEEAGPAAGEALLLVAGLTMQLTQWPEGLSRPLVDAGFRVIRYDHRDIGLSGAGDRGVRFDLRRDMMLSRMGLRVRANYTLYDLAEDLIGLMDVLDISQAHVVGVSMGGMIGQIVAAKYPHRVKTLSSIMSSTNEAWLPPPTLPVIRQMFFRKPANRERENVVRHAAEMMRLLASPGYPTPEAELKRIAERAYDRADRPGGVLRQTHAIVASGGFAHLLPKVSAPPESFTV